MNRIILVALLLLITVLLIIDYFPELININMNSNFILAAFILAMVVSLVANRTRDDREYLKSTLLWQMTGIVYILLLVSILTILGGSSDTIISLTNIFFWLAIGISAYDAYNTYSELKKLDRKNRAS